jgi:hypothetical protein
MNIMTFIAMSTIVRDIKPIFHIDAIILALRLAGTTTNTVKAFDNYTSEQRLKLNIIFAVLTVGKPEYYLFGSSFNLNFIYLSRKIN